MNKPIGDFPSKYDKIADWFDEAMKPKCSKCGKSLSIYAYYDDYYEIRHCEHCGYTNKTPRVDVKKKKLLIGGLVRSGKTFASSVYKCPSCKTPLTYSHEDDKCISFSCPNCHQLVLARKK